MRTPTIDIRPARRVRPGAALILLLAGCTVATDAPCSDDGDCRVAGEACFEGRCTTRPCAPGDLEQCAFGPDAGCLGVRRCLAGRFGPCEPPAEACNGADDDCDGRVDEAFDELGADCAAGVGACATRGRWICAADGLGTRCDAALLEGRAETCDGVDEDCDGVVDERLGAGAPCRVGVGACAAQGFEVCDAGAFVCDAAAGPPAAERCDGLDDDCDGRIDEVEGLGEPCRVGVGACAVGGRRVCAADGGLVCDAEAGAPAGEVCNGADDDCNGQIDDVEGLGAPCTVGLGECAADGVRVCGAAGLVCDARPIEPVIELCGNRLDDDCDGVVDDRAFCAAACGNGRREPGETCDDGNLVDGDGCSAQCAVEAGFACVEGPADTLARVDGVTDCEGWRPVATPGWVGGYGVAYAGGAVRVSADPPRHVVAYGVQARGPAGPADVFVGLDDDRRFAEAETAELAEDAALGRFDRLPPGDYALTFPDDTCADNAGGIEVALRTLDHCGPACADDDACIHLGHRCVEGRCLAPPPACGDGARDPGEGCDDGDLDDGDGCSAECAVEPGFVCAPLDFSGGAFDTIDGPTGFRPRWAIGEDGLTVRQSINADGSHYATRLPLRPGGVVRFTFLVAGFDDDFIGWSAGGGPTALTAPGAPYLLFSWKQSTQSEPDFGLAERGLRVGRVDGPVDAVELWQFIGEALEQLALALTAGGRGYRDRVVYTVSLVSDADRLRVYLDGVLELDLRDVPPGDGRLGLYVNSQEAVTFELLEPLALDACEPL